MKTRQIKQITYNHSWNWQTRRFYETLWGVDIIGFFTLYNSWGA